MSHVNRRQLRLIDDAQELADAKGPQEIGYLASLFTRTSLPYKNPGDIALWTKRNGSWVMVIQPGITERNGVATSIGLPYGTMPRLLLAWLCTEAARTQSDTLVLGPSLAAFMRQLGLQPTGGQNGSITRLREQTNRLFNATLSFRWEGNDRRDVGARVNIASAWSLYWPKNLPKSGAEQLTLDFKSTVTLDPTFFKEIIKHPVPFFVPALRALRGSPVRLDIYVWLTWRMFKLHEPVTVSWANLKDQFGSNFGDTRQGWSQFRRDFQTHLREVQLVYPQANVEVNDTGLFLRPSRTHVPLAGLGMLTAADDQRQRRKAALSSVPNQAPGPAAPQAAQRAS